MDDQDDDAEDPDVRVSQHVMDKRIQRDTEFDDSDDEGEGGRRDQQSWKEQEGMDVEDEPPQEPVKAPTPPKTESDASLPTMGLSDSNVLHTQTHTTA